MVELDKNELVATSCFPQTQKYCYALIIISVALPTMSLGPVVTSEEKFATALYIICFSLKHIMSLWETALLLTLSKSIINKLSVINALVQNHACTYVNLRKVLPLSKPQMADKFLRQENNYTAQRIRKIMEMHYQLTALSVKINELFECQILIGAAVNFEEMTFFVYYFFAQLSNAANLLMEEINIAVYSSILAGEILLCLAAFQGMHQMVCTLESTHEHVALLTLLFLQAQKTQEYIHDMWNANKICLRKEIVPVMQLASVQVLLTAPSFSARGWFLLDMSFVHMVKRIALN